MLSYIVLYPLYYTKPYCGQVATHHRMSEQRFPEPNIVVGSIEPRALKMSIDDGTEIFLFDICNRKIIKTTLGPLRDEQPAGVRTRTRTEQLRASQDALTSE